MSSNSTLDLRALMYTRSHSVHILQTVWPAFPLTGSNLTSFNEAWKWATSRNGKKPDWSTWLQDHPQSQLGPLPPSEIFIRHVLYFSSQTHIPEISMSPPSLGSLPDGRQNCIYSCTCNYIWFFKKEKCSHLYHHIYFFNFWRLVFKFHVAFIVLGLSIIKPTLAKIHTWKVWIT